MATQGMPSNQTWVESGDVIVRRGKFYVRERPLEASLSRAESHFEAGVRRGLGVALQAFCFLENSTCCFVEVPKDEDEAERSLMLKGQVKMSVVCDPPRATLVRHQLRWRLLSVGAKDYWRLGSGE
jgi:hypothetical protein